MTPGRLKHPAGRTWIRYLAKFFGLQGNCWSGCGGLPGPSQLVGSGRALEVGLSRQALWIAASAIGSGIWVGAYRCSRSFHKKLRRLMAGAARCAVNQRSCLSGGIGIPNHAAVVSREIRSGADCGIRLCRIQRAHRLAGAKPRPFHPCLTLVCLKSAKGARACLAELTLRRSSRRHSAGICLVS